MGRVIETPVYILQGNSLAGDIYPAISYSCRPPRCYRQMMKTLYLGLCLFKTESRIPVSFIGSFPSPQLLYCYKSSHFPYSHKPKSVVSASFCTSFRPCVNHEISLKASSSLCLCSCHCSGFNRPLVARVTLEVSSDGAKLRTAPANGQQLMAI